MAWQLAAQLLSKASRQPASQPNLELKHRPNRLTRIVHVDFRTNPTGHSTQHSTMGVRLPPNPALGSPTYPPRPPLPPSRPPTSPCSAFLAASIGHCL